MKYINRKKIIRNLTHEDFNLLSIPAGYDELVDFYNIFNNNNPVEVEIGAGKGKLLIARAEIKPTINFLALDWSNKWLKIGREKAKRKALSNLKFLVAEAFDFVVYQLPNESISIFHIYFPDPWHKKKHNKRRLLTASFIDLLFDKLSVEGKVEIATDNVAYYEAILEDLPQLKKPWNEINQSVNERIFPVNVKTSYEIKYENEGRPIYYLELKKN